MLLVSALALFGLSGSSAFTVPNTETYYGQNGLDQHNGAMTWESAATESGADERYVTDDQENHRGSGNYAAKGNQDHYDDADYNRDVDITHNEMHLVDAGVTRINGYGFNKGDESQHYKHDTIDGKSFITIDDPKATDKLGADAHNQWKTNEFKQITGKHLVMNASNKFEWENSPQLATNFEPKTGVVNATDEQYDQVSDFVKVHWLRNQSNICRAGCESGSAVFTNATAATDSERIGCWFYLYKSSLNLVAKYGVATDYGGSGSADKMKNMLENKCKKDCTMPANWHAIESNVNANPANLPPHSHATGIDSNSQIGTADTTGILQGLGHDNYTSSSLSHSASYWTTSMGNDDTDKFFDHNINVDECKDACTKVRTCMFS